MVVGNGLAATGSGWRQVTQQSTFGLHKMRRIIDLVEEVLASRN